MLYATLGLLILMGLTIIVLGLTLRQRLDYRLRLRKTSPPTETEHLRMLLEERNQEIRRLTNLLITRNPAEFSMVQQVPTSPQTTTLNGYSDSSDAGEYARWAATAQGLLDGVPFEMQDAGFNG